MKKCLYLVLIAATLVSTVRFSYAETSPLTMVLPDARRPTHFVQISHYINTIRLLQSNIVMVTGPNEYDGISFWDIQSGQLIRTIPGGGEEVRVSSKEDRLLEVDSQSKPIHYRLRDMRTGRLIRKWTSIEYFQTATSSLSLVATSSFRKGIYLNDTATGHQQKPLTQSDSEIYFSVDDKYALLPGYNRPSYIVRMSDRRSWKLPKLYSMRMSRDGHRLFGMSPDGSLHIWDMGTFAHRTITTGLKRGYFAVELPDHSIAVTGLLAGQKDQFQVRSPDGKNLLRKFQGPFDQFSPRAILVGRGYDPLSRSRFGGFNASSYEIFNPVTGKRVACLDVSSDLAGSTTTHCDYVSRALAISPDGRYYAHGAASGLLRFFDIQAPEAPKIALSADTGRKAIQYTEAINDAALLPDGGAAVCGENKNQYPVFILDGDEKVTTRAVSRGLASLSALGVSPDGRYLVGSSQWGIWRLDRLTGKISETPITTAKNGELYYSLREVGPALWLQGSDKPLEILSCGEINEGPLSLTQWTTLGKQEKTRVIARRPAAGNEDKFEIHAVVPSPDGKKIFVVWVGLDISKEGKETFDSYSGKGYLEIRQTTTGKLLRQIILEKYARSALGRPVWSADGSQIAIPDEMGIVSVYNSTTGKKVAQLSGTRKNIYSQSGLFGDDMFGNIARLAFSPGGQFLAAACSDGTLYIYSLRSRLPVAQVGFVEAPHHTSDREWPNPVRWLSFSANGKKLYAVTYDNALRVWDVPDVSP